MQAQAEKQSQTATTDLTQKSGSTATFQFKDDRPEAIQMQKMQQIAEIHAQDQPIQKMAFGGKPIQLAKDAALKKIREKDGASTPTKTIKTKGGEIGVFRFPQAAHIIDTFINQNKATAADLVTAKQTHADAKLMEIPVKVADHNLAAGNLATPALSDAKIKGDDRGPHFTHADNINGTAADRSSYTWHHKSALGKMELVDMNVHGAMWHHGGIKSWGASKHTGADSDDDPTKDDGDE